MITSSDFCIETHNLDIGYATNGKSITVQKELSIALASNQLIALIGENGVGKSTFIKTLCRLQPALKGTITINSKPITEFTPTELAQHISVVLTDVIPNSNLSCYELIALGRQPYTNWMDTLSEIDKTAIDNAIQLTQTQDLMHKKHHELSDGQLQRVLIARSLAQDTPIIILDEPTTHLDLSHKVSLLKLLKKLSHQTQKCILYSTHDIDLAIQLADEILVFTPNKIHKNTPKNLISQGVFDRLFDNPDIIFNREKETFSIK